MSQVVRPGDGQDLAGEAKGPDQEFRCEQDQDEGKTRMDPATQETSYISHNVQADS